VAIREYTRKLAVDLRDLDGNQHPEIVRIGLSVIDRTSENSRTNLQLKGGEGNPL
jgi:hypothetical protein